MHAFLFVGGTREEREKAIRERLREWNVSAFDQIGISAFGIEDIRQFQRRLQLAPLESPIHVGVIRDAELLTLPAQQALLKTLEEPPARAKIILETANADALLATILSRCTTTNLGSPSQFTHDDMDKCAKILKKLMESSPGERLMTIDEIAKTKEEVSAWVDLAIATSRQAMLEGDIQAAKLIKNLLTARRQLSVNVNPKLVLDNVFL